MPRPQTKADLLKAAQENYTKLITLVNSMTEQELQTPFDFSDDPKKTEAHWKRDKNVRDVIVHLHEWHNLMLAWLKNNKSGIRKPFLMEGYNWKTYGDMNLVFWKHCQTKSLEDAMSDFKNSHTQIMDTIESMSNEELFSKSFYDWVGGSSIGSYFVSTTSSHYDWAIKKINTHRKKVNV